MPCREDLIKAGHPNGAEDVVGKTLLHDLGIGD